MSYDNNRDKHMYQASMTLSVYMSKMRAELDEAFGPGFAEENPAIFKDFVLGCVKQYQADVIADALESLANSIELAINSTKTF